jgi:transcriptional regulator with XRE-family HTH domain
MTRADRILARRLKEARGATGYTLAEVSARTKINIGTLSLFERALQIPKIPQLRELAKTYRRPVTDFLSVPVPGQPHADPP